MSSFVIGRPEFGSLSIPSSTSAPSSASSSFSSPSIDASLASLPFDAALIAVATPAFLSLKFFAEMPSNAGDNSIFASCASFGARKAMTAPCIRTALRDRTLLIVKSFSLAWGVMNGRLREPGEVDAVGFERREIPVHEGAVHDHHVGAGASRFDECDVIELKISHHAIIA